MAIEINEFAEVSISVSPTGVQGGNFGILGFLTKSSDAVKNPIAPAERARAYTGLPSVGDDWEATSEVYKAATAFYGQTPQPRDFVVLMNYDTAQAAKLVGGTHEELADLVAVTAGSMSIVVDGITVSSSAIDLSGAGDMDAVAAALTADLFTAEAACTYGTYGFEITSATTGLASTISYGTGDVAELLGFAAYQAAVSDGVAEETPVDSLAETVSKGIQFVGLVTHKDFRDVLSGATGETTLEIGQWAEAAKKIFCNTSNSLSCLNSAITTDIGSVMKSATLRFTLTSFSKNANLYPSASVFGRAASVNFDAIGSTITLNLKQMPGIVAEDLTPGEFAVLRSKYMSAVVKIGSSANAYTDSRMASGSWLDTTHGLLWLENRCEVDMFNFLYVNNTKVPFTQAGINSTAAVLTRSLEAAVRNGLAAPGFLPDGTYLPEGFVVNSVKLADVPVGDKGNRVYRGLSFKMVGAGAMHEIVVAGEFSE